MSMLKTIVDELDRLSSMSTSEIEQTIQSSVVGAQTKISTTPIEYIPQIML